MDEKVTSRYGRIPFRSIDPANPPKRGEGSTRYKPLSYEVDTLSAVESTHHPLLTHHVLRYLRYSCRFKKMKSYLEVQVDS